MIGRGLLYVSRSGFSAWVHGSSLKAQKNADSHGVTFEEAVTVFYDPLLLTFFDAEHSDDENRFQSIGTSDRNRILLIIHTDRGDTIRIIRKRGRKLQEL